MTAFRTLVVDAGNTRIKWRLVDVADETPLPLEQPRAFDAIETRVVTDAGRALDRSFGEQPDGAVTQAWIASVAGLEVRHAIGAAIERRWPAATIEDLAASTTRCGVRNGYRAPGRLGPDRWAALLGAWASKPGRDALVCSFGTATTIDLLVAEPAAAAFVGGLILPGRDAMRRSLARETARLPIAEGMRSDFAVSTDDAIESGIVEAQLGAVERAQRHATRRRGRPPLLLFAGGGAAAMREALGEDVEIVVVPDLVLRGLEAVAREAVLQPAAAGG